MPVFTTSLRPHGGIASGAYGGGGTTPELYVKGTSGRQMKIHNSNAGTSSLQITNATTGEGEDAGTQLFTQGSTGDFYISNQYASGDISFNTRPSGGSNTKRLTIDSEGVIAHGPFASFAYNNLPGLFNVHSGARVNTGGAQQYAAPKGGFVDNARYELENKLITVGGNQGIIQAINGVRLYINNGRDNWSHYNNLPNYLLGHPATDCINCSNYSVTFRATMTAFLQRTNGWNSVPLTGWEILETDTNIYPGNTDSRLYVKTFAAGSYTFDSDSAMYFFML